MPSDNQTKLRLKDALLELMKTTDADKITAVDLARQAELSRATLYRYYDSVDEILRELEDDFLEKMRDCSRYYISAHFDLKSLSVPHPAFMAVAEYFRGNSRTYLTLSGIHGSHRFLPRTHKVIREFYCGKLAYEGLARKNMDVYIEFVLAGHDAMTRYWLEERPDISLEDAAVITQKMLFSPFVF